MRVEVLGQPFDPWAELVAYQGSALAAGGYGGTAVFVGTMRDFNEGDEVREMFLEHYPGMTGRHLETITRDTLRRCGALDALVLHRHGRILPGDPIVLVAVWAAHRAAAFAACQGIVEDLKSRAPFWKKETLADGERWVEHNTSGRLEDNPPEGGETMDDKTRTEIEAAVYRRLVDHLRMNPDVQNIDLMNLAGFCRNCLSKWYRAAAEEKGLDVSYEQAREIVYGMPYGEWKEKHQKEATPEQKKAFEAGGGH